MEITIDNISFSHGESLIIEDLSCQFKPGRFYALVGPNGSGKTTFLDMVSGFRPPDRGKILLGQSLLGNLPKKQIAKAISLVSQNYRINFSFSVEDVVMMGRHPYIERFSLPTDKDRKQVKEVMALTGISGFKDRPITELSGGEKQRCVFARALCQDTPVLLLDEAFSNMDINHSLQMLGLVKQAVVERGKIVVAVLHDLNLAAAWADEILFLKRGRIKAMGPAREVLSEEIVQEVFGVNSKVEFNTYVDAKQIYFKSI